MSKFKIGDKVRRIKIAYRDIPVGYIGTVSGISTFNTWINVDNYTKGDTEFPFHEDNFELVIEEPKITQQFKAMKIRIKDAIHSRMVQETLFEMGYGWVSYGKNVMHLEQMFLIVDADGSIFHCGNNDKWFALHNCKEMELVTTYAFKPVDKREEKEALEKSIAEMQKQLDEMKQKLENM